MELHEKCSFCGRDLKLEFEKVTGECLTCGFHQLRVDIARLAEISDKISMEVGSNTTSGGLLIGQDNEPIDNKVRRLEDQLRTSFQIIRDLCRYSVILALRGTLLQEHIYVNSDDLSVMDNILEPIRQRMVDELNKVRADGDGVDMSNSEGDGEEDGSNSNE